MEFVFERMIKTAAQRDDSLLEGACHGVVVRVHSDGLTKGMSMVVMGSTEYAEAVVDGLYDEREREEVEAEQDLKPKKRAV